MSFLITLYVREGIVMASDSRLQLAARRMEGEREIHQLGVGQSDSIYKTFLTYNDIGISTFGAPDIGGVPITGYIESFIADEINRQALAVDEVPQALIDYFGREDLSPDTGFLVAGYKPGPERAEQHVWEALVKPGVVRRLNEPNKWGAAWRGVTDVLARLLAPVQIQEPGGELKPLPHFPIQWAYFTLQDAIDYAKYAVQVTADTIRFQPRAKAVGGPVDILVIKPGQAFWVKYKDLVG